MRKFVPVADAAPIGAINVTPFIDVMLVLLIVMILSMPMVTHKVPVDLPQGGAALPDDTPHRLAIDRDGALFWDGARLADTALPGKLAALRSDAAVLQLQTDPEARYDRFDAVLATIKRANIVKLGFVGNQPLSD
ncbi:ExbD/TolR family protein [Sphingomonas azotifigens]|uniref:ExbD/TolR family protein n=1 Tax=Sphingomonas azotifigens TaxID=330920 RepID=UPI000A068070|nr:biopolymer transporter ExbD [Sphingomonas azotifigens]